MKLGKVRYCKKCVTPSSLAIPIEFDNEGVCSACNISSQVDNIDWDRRLKQLNKLLNRYKSVNNENYDCLIPVSGGKDSTFATELANSGQNEVVCLMSMKLQIHLIFREIKLKII